MFLTVACVERIKCNKISYMCGWIYNIETGFKYYCFCPLPKSEERKLFLLALGE